MTNRLLTLALISFVFGTQPATVEAQDLIDIYRENRVRVLAESVVDVKLIPLAPEVLGRRTVDLEFWPQPELEETEELVLPTFEVVGFQKVPKLGRTWFKEKFPDLTWSYEGSYRISRLDTMYTREIRARMEAQFGSPTQTLPDQGLLHRLDLPEYVQFEYWFVVNDSIPLVFIDVNGPFERGIVSATDERFRKILTPMRDAFLSRIVTDPTREKYADYYYEEELRTWFITGFDGRNYFMNRVDPRRVNPGRPVVPN